MSEADAYRQLAAACDEIVMWRNFVALLPYTVHVDHEYERAMGRAARLLARIPTQRAPSDSRRAPSGSPARPNTVWGTRSARR